MGELDSLIIIAIASVVVWFIFKAITSGSSGSSVALRDKSPHTETFTSPPEKVFKAALEMLRSDPEIRIDRIDEMNFAVEGSTEMTFSGKHALGILVSVKPQEKSGECNCSVYVKAKAGFGPFAESTAHNKKVRIANSIKATILST